MPNGPRIRANNVYGVISDNPLSAAASTFNSDSLPLLPVVASAHAVIVLDPKRINGDPEIVVVTVHTAASTVATILRAQYGTSQRVHPVGTAWAHVPVDEDWIEILTSSNRPSNPYEGQFIFETDTNKLVGYGGVDWAPRDAGGQLGYVEPIVADQSAVAGAETTITGMSVLVTVGTGRRIKITAKGGCFSTTGEAATGEDDIFVRIKEGATQLAIYGMNRINSSIAQSYYLSAITTPTAGSHTYIVTFQRVAGAGTISHRSNAPEPGFLLVEDIGAA